MCGTGRSQSRHYGKSNCRTQNPEGCGWQVSRLESHPLPPQSWKGEASRKMRVTMEFMSTPHFTLSVSELGTPKHTPVSPVYFPCWGVHTQLWLRNYEDSTESLGTQLSKPSPLGLDSRNGPQLRCSRGVLKGL